MMKNTVLVVFMIIILIFGAVAVGVLYTGMTRQAILSPALAPVSEPGPDDPGEPPVEPPEPAEPEPEPPEPEIPPPPVTVIDSDEVAYRLGEIAARFSVRGCSLTIFEGENILASVSYGIAAVRGRDTILADSNTIYRTASISKLVSALLVMQQVDAGTIRLEDYLVDLIDPRMYDPQWPNDKPTLLQLLSHTSGVVDTRAYMNALSGRPFPTLDFLLAEQIPFGRGRPGSSYMYTNFGFGLSAAVIENATGQYFYEYARENLFEPMGIDASYIVEGIKNKEHIATFRTFDPVTWEFMAGTYDEIPLGQMYMLAHANLFTSADDLAKIIMILAGDGTLGGKRYISEESLALIHTPHVHIPEINTSRGLAAHITDILVEGVTLFGHQGDAYGAITCVFYDPLTGRGAVFLSNGADGRRIEENNMYAVNQDIIQMVWEFFGD
jgi:CubicO group peptidase (beta-lactamase class C family)